MRTRFLTTSHASLSEQCRDTSSSVKLPRLAPCLPSSAGLALLRASATSAAHLLNSLIDPTTPSYAPRTARADDWIRPACGRVSQHIVGPELLENFRVNFGP